MARPDKALLHGAIDMHAHTHPALFPRPIDDADLAKIALEHGMRGFVLKDHDSSTLVIPAASLWILLSKSAFA